MSSTTTTSVERALEPILCSLDRPSRWLHAGYVPYTLGDATAWIYVRADYPIDPSDAVITRLKFHERRPDDVYVLCNNHHELRQLAPPGPWARP